MLELDVDVDDSPCADTEAIRALLREAAQVAASAQRALKGDDAGVVDEEDAREAAALDELLTQRAAAAAAAAAAATALEAATAAHAAAQQEQAALDAQIRVCKRKRIVRELALQTQKEDALRQKRQQLQKQLAALNK